MDRHQIGKREGEREREATHAAQSIPIHSLLPIFWPTLLWTRTGTQDSMNWPSGLQIRTFVLKQDISRFSGQLLQS